MCFSSGLVDEQQKVRTISALAIAALAEAATPYGIESFDSVLKPLWKGIRQHRGKVRTHNLFFTHLLSDSYYCGVNLYRFCGGLNIPNSKVVTLSLCPGSGCVPQSHWLPYSPDGRRVRQLLHQRGDAHPYQRVPVPRRGDEEDCAQGLFGCLCVCVCVRKPANHSRLFDLSMVRSGLVLR